MALTAKRRSNLPNTAFAYPKTRRYPIHDAKHARAALARAAQSGTSGSYRTVAKAVRAKYGNTIASVGPTHGTTTAPGYRKGT